MNKVIGNIHFFLHYARMRESEKISSGKKNAKTEFYQGADRYRKQGYIMDTSGITLEKKGGNNHSLVLFTKLRLLI